MTKVIRNFAAKMEIFSEKTSSWSAKKIPSPQKLGARFPPLTLTAHFQWEDETVRERTGNPPSKMPRLRK